MAKKKERDSMVLPECGMFIGSAVSITARDYLFGNSGWHTKWICHDYCPSWYVRKIVEDNQGNTAALTDSRYMSGNALKAMASWMDLQGLGLTPPEPDWENRKYLSPGDWDEISKHKDRYGAAIPRFAGQAKDNGIYTMVLYGRGRSQWVKKAGKLGKWFLGLDIGEIDFAVGVYDDGSDRGRPRKKGPATRTLEDAARIYEKNIRAYLRTIKKEGWQRTFATSASFRCDCEIGQGVDVPLVEDFAFSSLNVSSALSRGLVRQSGKEIWGSWLAHEHFSFLPYRSKYKFGMLKAAMYLKYLSGAKMIILESGNWYQVACLVEDTKMHDTPNLDIGGISVVDPYKTADAVSQARKYYKYLDYESSICRRYREVLSQFYDFVKKNGTPPGQPETTIAVVKGYLDGAEEEYNPNSSIWGARNISSKDPNWYAGAPEMGWEIVKDIYFPRENCLGEFRNKWFSGTPYGMVDIVSLNCPIDADFLRKQYKALIFMGWNTATDRHYRLLKDYVKAGGKLFISLPHLCTNTTREYRNYTVDELIKQGDLRDLCGVRVHGKGSEYYWAKALSEDNPLNAPKNKVFGAWYTHTGDITCDDDVQIIAVDDQSPTNDPTPILLRHPCGKGEVYFLNSWEYPGALANDIGTSTTVSSRGIPGEVLKMLGRQCRGHSYITDDGREVGSECNYIAYSYFPSNGRTYLLNVDAAHAHSFVLHRKGKRNVKIRLESYGFKML